MELFVIWLGGSFLAGWIAGNKGRSGAGFFFLSILLSPLIGLIAAIAAPSLIKDPESPGIKTHRRCPECKELIRKDATKCKHCASDVEPEQADTSNDKHAPQECPKCGKSTGLYDQVCRYCGVMF